MLTVEVYIMLPIVGITLYTEPVNSESVSLTVKLYYMYTVAT